MGVVKVMAETGCALSRQRAAFHKPSFRDFKRLFIERFIIYVCVSLFLCPYLCLSVSFSVCACACVCKCSERAEEDLCPLELDLYSVVCNLK